LLLTGAASFSSKLAYACRYTVPAANPLLEEELDHPVMASFQRSILWGVITNDGEVGAGTRASASQAPAGEHELHRRSYPDRSVGEEVV
jgi:hypothetical protein